MPRLVRAAALTNYVAVAQAVGLDPWRMVREAGLPRACLEDRDLKVSVEAVNELLEASADRSGQEAFSLLMVEGRRISNLGILGIMTREEPTLRQAMQSFARYGRAHNESLVQRLEEARGIATIHEELLTDIPRSARQAMELVVGVAVRLMKVFLGADWVPRRICFTHAEPMDSAVHRRVLGRTPEFSCDFNGIVCTSAELDTPIASADAVVSAYLRKQLALDASAAGSVAEDVRQTIVLLLPSGRCTADQVAQLMGINRRTLNRRLAQEGLTYLALLNELRRMLVQRYLADRHRTITDIAQLLGFGPLSSFSRWHRQEFGRTADAMRRLPVTGKRASPTRSA